MSNFNTTEEEKWQFCPDKECPYCLSELDDSLPDKIITGCPDCKRSFIE